MDVHIGKNGVKRRFPRMTRVAIPALLAVATAACTVGPNFVRPETAHGSAYTKSAPSAESTTSVTFGGEVAEDWDELFHSDALNDLVRQALAGNPDLEAARHGRVATQFELKAVAGTALPQIDAAGQVGRARVNGSFLESLQRLYGPYSDYALHVGRTLGNTADSNTTLASIYQNAVSQATLLSCLDDFKVFGVVLLVLLPLLLLIRPGKAVGRPGMAH
jgi:outer membrane protein TolC